MGWRGAASHRRPRPAALAFAALFLSLAARSALAHPHVWIDYQLTLKVDRGRIVAVHEEWSIDEYETTLILRDIAGDRPVTALTPADVAALEKNAFSNLQNYGYFTHVTAGAATVAVGKVNDFAAHLAAGKLIYDFTVPLAAAADAKSAPVNVGIWDETYYVDVEPAAGKPIRFEGDGAAACKATTYSDQAHPIYFGSVFPTAMRVTC